MIFFASASENAGITGSEGAWLLGLFSLMVHSLATLVFYLISCVVLTTESLPLLSVLFLDDFLPTLDPVDAI